MSQETTTRTYSVQISDETFQKMKELEKATGIPREHIFTAMVDVLAGKDTKIVNEVVNKALEFQQSTLKAKMANGGFFTQTPVASIGQPSKPTSDTPKVSVDSKNPPK